MYNKVDTNMNFVEREKEEIDGESQGRRDLYLL